MKKTKSIAAIAMAAAIASTMMTTVVSADTGYYSGSYSASSYGTSNSVNKIPNMIYMTNYTSGGAERLAKASASVTAAEGLLANIDYATLGLPAPAFTGISLGFSPTKYDYLIKANAENGATVLTFNSEANLKAAMTKIKTEEQTIMNNALLPYRNYIDTLISNGAYTKVNTGDAADVKAAKLSNAALLAAAKNTLSYTYVDTDLFSGDVTGKTKTYQIAYLSEASIGNSSTQTVVSNDEEFTNFPRLIIDGQILDWGSVHHLNLFNNSNDSWWFAIKDGNTLNNDYYWLKGMMIPDFNETISFDAYAGNEWTQYGEASNSNNNNTDNNDYTNNYGYYYNASYNYVSDNVYAVSDGYTTYYYPNITYAKAAIAANREWYISNVITSGHSDYARYFCFIDGMYYSSANQSRYPSNTVYMKNAYGTSDTPSNTEMNYYFNDGNVYDKYGKLIGTAASRGYSSTNTWFCASDGRFYPTAQTGKTGYYVSASNTNTIDQNDPYYQYWMLRIESLMKELSNNNNNSSSSSNNSSSSSNSSSSNSSSSGSNSGKNDEVSDDETSTSISASKLAALRASGDTIKIKPLKSATWTICGDNVTTPRDINLKITYNTNNIPSALKKAVLKDATASVPLTVGENLSWGTNASLTVKFNAERANFIAKLYRYNTATGTLELVNNATVGNTGSVTFNNINHGGEYLITLG